MLMKEVDVFDRHQATLKAVSALQRLCESDGRLTAAAATVAKIPWRMRAVMNDSKVVAGVIPC